MRKGKCKHFRGIQHQTCLAGIDWRKVTGGDSFGIANRMPCFRKNDSPAKCSHYVEPTDEEVKKMEAEWDAVLDRMMKLQPFLSEWRKKQPIGKAEVVECPICNGRLHLSQAACNGHVHGKCETDGCVSWME